MNDTSGWSERVEELIVCALFLTLCVFYACYGYCNKIKRDRESPLIVSI